MKGDRKGRHSIRINDQWRICFLWKDGDAHAAFGTSARFWLGLQADHDLEEARRDLGKKVERIERIAA